MELRRLCIPLAAMFIAWLPGLECSTDVLQVDPGDVHQTIEGFGASDAWNAEFIGRHWDDQEKEKAARLLFSKDWNEHEKPEGAGLSVWRVNIGAGSAEQGEASGISNPTRRASSYLDPDGKDWDWSRSPGQRWFLQKAQAYGVEQFVAFAVSPHVSLTKNGLARASGEIRSNLREDAYEDYAASLRRVLEFYRDEAGVSFDYLSPLNEPQYPWNTAKQEGCSYTNGEIARLVDVIGKQLYQAGLRALVLLPEAADWESLYKVKGDADYSNQIETFFAPQSPHYIGDQPHVAPVAAAHSYWFNRTAGEIRSTRMAARAKAQTHGVGLRQTEYSLIGLARIEEDKPESRWDIALFTGKVMLADLRFANVTCWSFWTAFEQDIWNYQNQFQLIRIEANDNNDLSQGGRLIPEKNLWVMAHFSRFVRPGWQRIGLGGADDLNGLAGVAFRSPDGESQVLVILNASRQPLERKLQSPGSGGGENKSRAIRAWTTTEDLTFESLPLSGDSETTLIFPPRSITSILLEPILPL